MLYRSLVLLLCLCAVACSDDASSTADTGQADSVSLPDAGPADAQLLTWGPCETADWPDGYPPAPADLKCATVAVPWDHAAPGGKTISLRIARQPAKSGTGKALFYFAGGPGGTAVGSSGAIPSLLPGIEQQFDLIYVDQRGTGGSGRMECKAGYPRTAQAWVACGKEHAGTDLRHHLTTDAAHDVDWVRRQLGYDKIHVLGVSYGTTLALEYLRQHGDTVAAAVIDSVVQPDLDIMGEMTKALDRGIDRLVSDCGKDPACTAVSPQLAVDLAARRQTLKQTPRPILYNGAPTVEDEELYVQALQALLDAPQARAMIPRAIHLAVQGANTQWNALLSALTGGTVTDVPAPTPRPSPLPPPLPVPPRVRRDTRVGMDYVAAGLFMTIACAEWFPTSDGLDALKSIHAGTTWPHPGHVELAQGCAGWTVTPAPAAYRAPVVSQVPTLLLSGDLDLRTWPDWAAAAAKHLGHGTHVILPHTGHATVNYSCASGMAVNFLKSDGAGTVDSSCTKSIAGPSW